MQTWRSALLGAFAACVSGCGDPVLPGSTLTEPAFTIHGAIAPYERTRPLPIGVLWADPVLAGGTPSVSGAEKLDVEITADGSFSLEVFGRPPKDAVKLLSADASSDAVALAWGELVLFEDNDADGTFRVDSLDHGAPISAPDKYAGVAEKHVLLFVEQPAEEGTQIIGLARTLAGRGYVLGEANCDGAPYVIAVEPNTVSVRATAATAQFPRVRPCFESIP